MQNHHKISIILGFIAGGLLSALLLLQNTLWSALVASISLLALAIYQSKHIRIIFLQSVKEQKIEALLKKIANPRTRSRRRLNIGNKLANLGDNRKGVGLDKNNIPDIDWVKISAGTFIYGEGSEEITSYLDTFYISRYTITHCQFQAFIDDNGYQPEAPWWKGLQLPEKKESRWTQPNRSKESINWYEAIAFCRWLSHRKGDAINLPTEQQWEKATRGKTANQYPWGNDYKYGFANTDEIYGSKWNYLHPSKSYLKQTTAVGMYPQGASDYGVMDLSGNLWEWCLNKYDKPENTLLDNSSDSRVLRGGSWDDDPNDARSANRGRYVPDSRGDGVGCRVVCSLPSDF